jgi:hypothetical protein
MTKNEYKAVLLKYIPREAFEAVYSLIIKNRVYLSITKKRKTKHGDFRPAINGSPARISVNYNLNTYAFLITFLHELAHQLTWNKYKNTVKPHGPEWKKAFHELLLPFMQNGSFPQNIVDQLKKDSSELYHSTTTDTDLARELKQYDADNGLLLLESLAENTRFIMPNGTRFIKLNKRRKNFLCRNLDNNRLYVFNPLAEVYVLNE